MLAGGGVKRGHVLRRFLRQDWSVPSHPIRCGRKTSLPTMFHLLGIDPKSEVRDAVNRPLPISPGNVIEGVVA